MGDNPKGRDPERPATGFLEPPGKDPGDRSRDSEPHHALNNPVGEPDPTEWPDPYDRRPDPSGPPTDEAEQERHPPTGATSTSQPRATEDPEAEPSRSPEHDRLDD